MNTLKKILSRLVGNANTLSNNVLFIDFTGSHEKGQYLSQLFYWSGKTKMKDGFFAKSYADWYEEIRIKEHSIRRYTKEFKSFGWLETKVVKFNKVPTLHYKLDQDKLITALVTFCDTDNLRPSHGARVDPDNLQGSREPDTVQGSINRDLHRLHTERERAHEKENNIQPKQNNNPPKVALKGSLDINPLKYESTAIFFANQLQKTFPTSIKELQNIVGGKIGEHIKSYFRNLQKKDEWYQLQEPDESRMNSWISKHYAGVEMWLKNEKKFWPTKEDKNKVRYEAPKNVFTADQLKKSA